MKEHTTTIRPPVVAVMGHIDHGKSTLLDYIRKTNIVEKEAGGITQRMSAYKVSVTDNEGKEKMVTFLDTPGHEAFGELRSRGAKVADIAILVVAADEGVKPQTIEALKTIKDAGIPFIVAMNKIDRPNSDIEKLKGSLAENEIFVEGYGGDVPAVPVSGIKGTGVKDLLDMILLMADLAELKTDVSAKPEAIVIEASSDKTKGISATLILKQGTLKEGHILVAETGFTQTRILEDFQGKKITTASASDPVRVVGWSSLPPMGSIAVCVSSKKEAEELVENNKLEKIKSEGIMDIGGGSEHSVTIPIVIKASSTDVLEAIIHEIKKVKHERIILKILNKGIGFISESDVKLATSKPGSVVLGFDTKIDNQAKILSERDSIKIETFSIIYKLTEWLEAYMQEKMPKISIEELRGKGKILKFFSATKDKQVLGVRVVEGSLAVGDEVKIMRREAFIAKGRIKGLQQSKVEVKEVVSGLECGAMIEAKMELAPGDFIEAYSTVEK